MTKLSYLTGDTSSSDWTDYTPSIVLTPTMGNGTDIPASSHQTVWQFTPPAEWTAENQRAMIVGHACFEANNFTGRRPFHAWATGGISVASAGVCGCAHENSAGSTMPGYSNRVLAIDFMLDVRFTGGATSVQIRWDNGGTVKFRHAGDYQSLLWVVATDERQA